MSFINIECCEIRDTKFNPKQIENEEQMICYRTYLDSKNRLNIVYNFIVVSSLIWKTINDRKWSNLIDIKAISTDHNSHII